MQLVSIAARDSHALGQKPRHHWMPGGTWGVRRTLKQMKRIVNDATGEPAIHEAAIRILHGQATREAASIARAVQQWCQANLDYRNDPRRIEWLQTPAYTLEILGGDCDEFTTLICALLETVNLHCRMVAMAQRNDSHGQPLYSHVYPEVLIGGRWIVVEATQDYQLGQVPPSIARIVVEC